MKKNKSAQREKNYLSYDLDNVNQKDTIKVSLSSQANLKLLDDQNFQAYQEGEKYQYYGGFAKESPIILNPPHQGHWNLVIDLGGYPGRVKAEVKVIKVKDDE